MKTISEVISELEEIRKVRGDLSVMIYDVNSNFVLGDIERIEFNDREQTDFVFIHVNEVG